MQGEGLRRVRKAGRAVVVLPMMAEDKVAEMQDKTRIEAGFRQMAFQLFRGRG